MHTAKAGDSILRPFILIARIILFPDSVIQIINDGSDP